jgi:ribonuclease HII
MTLDWYAAHSISPDDSIGIDEVGRGPLAGPVIAAAVWISTDLAIELLKNSSWLPVRDSKKMTHNQRNRIVEWAKEQSKDKLKYSITDATVEEIDRLNILQASLLAMQRTYSLLDINKEIVLVDGNAAPNIKNTRIITVIKGDAQVLTIALASIVAKEHRDSLMKKLSNEFPQYGWNTNMGYGSKSHLQAIEKFGITPHHRKSFAPMNRLIHSHCEPVERPGSVLLRSMHTTRRTLLLLNSDT